MISQAPLEMSTEKSSLTQKPTHLLKDSKIRKAFSSQKLEAMQATYFAQFFKAGITTFPELP